MEGVCGNPPEICFIQERRYNNNHSNNTVKQEGPKREAILDLNKYKDQQVRVRFIGGREVVGLLKGFDSLMNLVLEEVVETIRDPEDDSVLTSETRQLGLVVIRGPALLTISPVDGTQVIENPYANPENVV
ncbi:putative U6 snRNA-associated Sm-like protein [Hyphopichia burtonii NRRL Y-1933]|uniref:Putative U6 snRNA-associated Sm-like protein n=1 Tax=Hyphopichia burtonii NRRL Y-1933 TaxID=984485 RepID=A0A1E4RDF9_9ASCO|nr:putative U6 snRNA-associated Sm-like protein [Hyphopichia burtonii NRRL Y-1933]ODV65304.1 putative U6 snRNA-associated Sm-like protein [Hyphopichia burtonii NRRL Y-1933]